MKAVFFNNMGIQNLTNRSVNEIGTDMKSLKRMETPFLILFFLNGAEVKPICFLSRLPEIQSVYIPRPMPTPHPLYTPPLCEIQ